MATRITKKTATIYSVAEEYQALSRQQKQLDATIKPLKEALLQFAKDNPEAFDDAFQLKFPCGTYISSRVSDVLNADERARTILVENVGTQYIETKLKDKDLIEAARANKLLQKQLTQAGASIEQKETLAVYAG